MTREIFIGDVGIGGNHPVSIQSMCNTDTKDVQSTLAQINRLKDCGCQIIRVAVPRKEVLPSFEEICKLSPLPVIADIHFSHSLAINSLKAGADAIRINPGNIGTKEKVLAVIEEAGKRNKVIRIGVNMGSIDKKYKGLEHHQAMVESALEYISFFEKQKFFNIKFSLKSSSVLDTVKAYRSISKHCDYPLHLGVTEAGTVFGGTVKSAIGIGSLLLDGIGNTIRVSLTDEPEEEIKVAKEILKVLSLRKEGVELISCPTCARTRVKMIEKAKDLENRLSKLKTDKYIKVAIMGCEVNGPGEAKGADIGIAYAGGKAIIFKDGKNLKYCEADKGVDTLLDELKTML